MMIFLKKELTTLQTLGKLLVNKMPVYWVPTTTEEQIKVIQDLKRLELQPDELQRLEMMQRHLSDYRFLDDKETRYLQQVIEQYGWML